MLVPEKEIIKYNGGYIIFYRQPLSSVKLNFGANKRTNFFDICEIDNLGIKVGWFFKPVKNFEAFEDSSFVCYKKSQNEEKPERKISNPYIFYYESQTGFFLATKTIERCRKGDF